MPDKDFFHELYKKEHGRENRLHNQENEAE